MKKPILFVILFLFIIMLIPVNNVSAAGTVTLMSDSYNIKKDDTISISINISNMSVAALTAKISFDANKLEYISGPENSNNLGGKIIFVWADENGGKTPKTNGEIATFTFKAKEEGLATFGIEGEFYDSNETEIEVTFSNTSVYIGEIIKSPVYTQENVGNDSSAYLSIMRLNLEGITPDFNKNITDYLIVVDTTVNSLDVTAIPENQNATVNITGNTNLKEGLNKILINVTSKDGTNKLTYTINVTKTANLEKANANLENLAIEYTTLEPEFSEDITQYTANIPSNIENLNILAIPQKSLASVNIIGGKNLQFGENIVKITVTAENGITIKTYTIKAYRLTETEEISEIQRLEKEMTLADQIIAESNWSEDNVNKIAQQSNTNKIIIGCIVLITIIAGIGIYIKIKKR